MLHDNALSAATRKRFIRFNNIDFECEMKTVDGQQNSLKTPNWKTIWTKMILNTLNIIQQLIFHRSKALGKIQMSGKWVAHELTEVYI